MAIIKMTRGTRDVVHFLACEAVDPISITTQTKTKKQDK
jgi:hypothetical protein